MTLQIALEVRKHIAVTSSQDRRPLKTGYTNGYIQEKALTELRFPP